MEGDRGADSALPEAQNLVRVDAGQRSSHQFYVDAASVSVGEDGVMRYTTVVKTAGGATNVTFEGMRCETREQKLYALGRSDGTWVRARDPKWQRVVLRDRHRTHLRAVPRLFLSVTVTADAAQTALEALRRGATRASAGAVTFLDASERLPSSRCASRLSLQQHQIVAVDQLRLVDVAELRFDFG